MTGNHVSTPRKISPDDDAYLQEILKRCSPDTYAAAREFRATRNAADLPAIILGITERFVEHPLRGKLQSAPDNLRLAEDLGIDSLTMMEIVILVEDVLQITIDNDQLRDLRTIGDVKRRIAELSVAAAREAANLDANPRSLPSPA